MKFLLAATSTLAFLIASPLAAGQESRTEEIQNERKKKAAGLVDENASKTEVRLLMFKDGKYLERFTAGYNGFRAKIGNMVTGGGFAIGPEYYREDLFRGRMSARASAQISTRGFQKYELETKIPNFARRILSFEALATYRNYSSLQYYGTGPDRPKELRANYRLEDTSIDGILGAQLMRHVKIGGSLGYLWTNVGPGNDKRFVSAEKVFTPAQSPGIDEQSNFLRPGMFAQYDYRDHTQGMAKSGGNYVFQYSWFLDQKLQRYSFRRLDMDLQQYIPFLNKTHVLALRAKTTMTETDRNEAVPFYLQPILGGSDDLRGYRFFRFNDRNMMVMNAEYRWEIFSGLDGAVFADAGKVTPRRGMLNFRDLESSVGMGLRFNARNATFIRIDVAASHEGVQVWFKFNDAFPQRRFGTTTGQPVY